MSKWIYLILGIANMILALAQVLADDAWWRILLSLIVGSACLYIAYWEEKKDAKSQG